MDCISARKNDAGINNSVISTLSLQELPTDVLLYIFKFSDLRNLLSLSCCCKRFYAIISGDSVWMSKSKVAVITNQLNQDVMKRYSMMHEL